jgi:hypothetical protein
LVFVYTDVQEKQLNSYVNLQYKFI